MNPKTVIKRLGGINAAAKKLGYTRRGIQYWLQNGRIPPKAQRLVYAALAARPVD